MQGEPTGPSRIDRLMDAVTSRWLPPEWDPADVEFKHQARLIVGFTGFGLLVALMFASVFVFAFGSWLAAAGIMAGGVLVLGIPLLLRRTGNIRLCSYLLGGLLIGVVVLITWLRGGFPATALIYLVPMSLGAFLVGWRTSVIWVTLALGIIVAAFVLAMAGYTEPPPVPLSNQMNLWLDMLGVVGLLLMMTFMTATYEASRLNSERERRRIAARLEQSERLESVGQLAGAVAHDFNNLLTVIRGSAEMALDDAPAGTGLHQDLVEIRAAADRAADLTGRLLLFSRRELVRPEALNLSEVLPELRSLLRRSLREDVELVVFAPDDLEPILADRRQIEQLLVNLAVNARDAMPAGGTFRLEASQAEVLGEQGPGEPPPGRYVQLEVADTGNGMPEEVAARAFEPFFTTKEKGLGTGLGLSTVHGIVRRFDGHIRLLSSPGQGCRFTLLFPVLADPQAVTAESGEYGDPAYGRGEQILLAEDDAKVRKTLAQLLVRSGYRVIEAVDGQQARELLDCEQPEVDLLLTDVVMPGLSGAELARWVKERHPSIRILFVSGYTDGELSAHGLEPERILLLRKPFSTDQLRAVVRTALGDEPGLHPAPRP